MKTQNSKLITPDWHLESTNGRSVWKFSAPEEFQHTNWEGPLNEREKKWLEELSFAFIFDKASNPNSADKVYRESRNTVSNSPPDTDSLRSAISFYKTLQTNDGNWPGDYGGPMFLLPGLIIASYVTDTPFPAPHRELMKRYMLNHQREDGGWGLHLEGHSTMFATVLQYVSLRILGMGADERPCTKAGAWIKANGGATMIPLWGKFYLSVIGIYEWEGINTLFPEMWLLPESLPMHPSRYWCHARMVYLPMSYCYAVRFTKELSPLTAALRAEIYTEEYSQIDWKAARNKCAKSDEYFPQAPLLKMMNSALNVYEKNHSVKLRRRAIDFLLEYINAEDEQTNFIDIGPVNKAMNSIAIFHAYGKDSTQFEKHRNRWYDYLWLAEDGMKMQGYNGSQFWDTAFAVQAISESGMESDFSETMEKAMRYIDGCQIREEVKERKKFYRHEQTGGFPFSNLEHGWPISDCSAEGLKVLLAARLKGTANFELLRFTQACDVILSYQNEDGGWASYENTRGPNWLEKLNPAELFGNIMIDYSYVECTSASVQSLIKFKQQFSDYRSAAIEKAIESGIRYILAQQREDGSWYGSWAVCFTYGGWFGTEALAAYLDSNFKKKDIVLSGQAQRALQKHTAFLLSKQQQDGGWGESFESCVQKKYIHSETSQIVNTSWAVLSLLLMPASPEIKSAVEKGIALLQSRQFANGDFPQENISGVFNHNCMITYTSYRNVFPIWAMGRHRKSP